MMLSENQADQIRKRLSSIRKDALIMYRGPHSISFAVDEEKFWGWATLTLEVQTAKLDVIESRSVYANLFDEGQTLTVLRAAYWDGPSARQKLRKEHQYDILLPARFVQLKAERLRLWLSDLNGLNIQLHTAYEADGNTEIRKLRIELDYVTWVFERVWQLTDSGYALLNQRWNHVWNQMTQALMNEPVIQNFEEHFLFPVPKVRYNFSTYQPERYTAG